MKNQSRTAGTDNEKYIKETVKPAVERIMNSAPNEYRVILNHLKKSCKLKSVKDDDSDTKLARLYFHIEKLEKLIEEITIN